jgi:hypothetical protein
VPSSGDVISISAADGISSCRISRISMFSGNGFGMTSDDEITPDFLTISIIHLTND